MPELWIPGEAGPQEEFDARIHRQIARFAANAGVERAAVDLELADGSRFALDTLSAEPGYGFVTLRPHATGNPDDPEELVVPIATIRRIELARVEDARRPFGFALPPADDASGVS